MKILILGGTGLIGGALERHLSADHEVECVGRSAFASQDVLNKLVQDKDLIIKLSGANIVKRWNAAYKQEIWDSRIETSKQLKIALDFLTNKPRIFCASAVGFYPESLCDQPFNEDCKHPGTGFLSDLVVAWEKSSESLAKEVLIFRFGVVLSVKGGALSQMLLPFKLGFGGPVAGGKQCFSWIHVGDLVKALKGEGELSEAQKYNLEKIEDNYTIHIFTQDSDFNAYQSQLMVDFPKSEGYIVTPYRRGEPYSKKSGLVFEINKEGYNPKGVGAIISHLDEWQDNLIMARWHNKIGSKDFVLRIAKNTIKNGYPAHFGLGHGYNSVAGAFHDPEWRKS